MVKRRALSRADKELQPDRLPALYKALVPLIAERHGTLYLSESRGYDFAQDANAVPLTVDEFPQAMRHYPIVFADGDIPTPVALVGQAPGRNDFVETDGRWRAGCYIPAYLRRYPFAYLRESDTADRNILCADLSSTLFDTKGDTARALFEDGAPSAVLKNVMDFCTRYETALARTRAAMEEAKRLDLIDTASATVTANGKTLKVEGFSMISEEKLRQLPDADLAGLARRGVLNIYQCHHLSMTNFSTMGPAL